MAASVTITPMANPYLDFKSEKITSGRILDIESNSDRKRIEDR
jgi:hypothetical protein